MKRSMPKTQRRRMLAYVTLFATWAGVCFSTGEARGSDLTAPVKPSCCSKELGAAAPVTDKSLYQLDSVWTNDRNEGLKLVSLRGRPQIVTLFFAKCEYACPILVHDMKRIEKALPENVRTNVGFVLASFDSVRDTPAALASYRMIHQLPANWTLWRGEPDDVLELAALLGVKYKKDLRGQFAHSNIITVLDADGEVVLQQVGLNQPVDDLVSTVTRLLSGSCRTSGSEARTSVVK